MNKLKFLKISVVLILVLIFTLSMSTNVFAHQLILNVDYDDCVFEDNIDGDDETWYMLYRPVTGGVLQHRHISDETLTISYWFEESAPNDSSYTWTSETGITEEIAEQIRTSYINSVMKWNNVYYYSYDELGNRISNKIINIVPGTETNHNLSIFPIEDNSIHNGNVVEYIAATGPDGVPTKIDTNDNAVSHLHYNNWYMYVNLEYFYYHTGISSGTVDFSREAVGEHEMGHILGLRDVDEWCSASSEVDHHEEVLMGYGTISYRTLNVTYKDISGVSITRGFHTDADHTWMKRTNDDGTIDLICAQCNGVLYDIDMDSNGITYQGQNVNIYQACKHHSGTTSNMLLVATDGERNFFKCQNCRHIETVEISEEYSLSNYTSTINKTINLSGNETKYYKINSNYNKYYEFIVDGTYGVDIKLFDENFNEILVDDLSDSNYIEHIINQLQVGTYYLEVKNSSSSTNSTSIKIVSRTTVYLGRGDNDVLLNTYNNISEYVYTHNQGPGIYRFKLNGTTIDETFITYPLNSLTLYTDSTRSIEVEKLYFDEDEILVYLPSNGAYYLNINLNEANYSSLVISVDSIEKNNIDYINGLTSVSFNILFENKNSLYHYEEVTIKQKSEVQLDIITNGTITDSIPVYVYSRIYDDVTKKYNLVETFIGEITPIDRAPVYTLVLEAGTYYFGYKNNEDNVNINFALRRMVDYNMNMEGILVADPDSTGYDLGTEVLINEGECDEYTITEGFTRNIYLMVEDRLRDPMSRLDYDWYSSNESVAIVTNYGTVLAMPVTIDTEVTIYAVLKDDPKIVYYRTFTVLNDEEENLEEIILNMSYSYSDSNGTYQLELNNTNCPYPMIQYYSWNIRNESEETVTMNQWGEISSTGICTVQIEGIYNLNTRVRLYITLTIE